MLESSTCGRVSRARARFRRENIPGIGGRHTDLPVFPLSLFPPRSPTTLQLFFFLFFLLPYRDAIALSELPALVAVNL